MIKMTQQDTQGLLSSNKSLHFNKKLTKNLVLFYNKCKTLVK